MMREMIEGNTTDQTDEQSRTMWMGDTVSAALRTVMIEETVGEAETSKGCFLTG